MGIPLPPLCAALGDFLDSGLGGGNSASPDLAGLTINVWLTLWSNYTSKSTANGKEIPPSLKFQ